MKKLIAAVALCVGSAAFAQQQPSQTQVPGKLWAPPRTDTSR